MMYMFFFFSCNLYLYFSPSVNNRDRIPSTDSFASAGGYPAIATLPRHDGKDRHDKMRGVPTPLATLGMQNRYGDSEDGRVVSAPNVNDADRLERTGSPDVSIFLTYATQILLAY